MLKPVPVLRLPRGPDGTSRGFDPFSPRSQAAASGSGGASPGRQLQQLQQLRAELRERYLRSLLAMSGRPVRFALHERVRVAARFAASDLDVANFHVADLQTPLGTQREALLRCSDIIAYSFQLGPDPRDPRPTPAALR
ncbi:gem-associated protein 7 [Ornithorhynchus anatinus]|uniref:Gem nuclear organelle associated protein 7 n=1 Tax=Ornithorhynchus anatinus TaxID=9258 RepID=F7GDX8_ORNAN|nr:gem-associated protein 7 [Ornithorhynchus anatinus]XP_028921172.1 gem-associated protein 7 [Ornithorhynchus anatinus]XP_028921173.1 gem-associated protein 7 [Ornithorhynchus anatinus]XP_028921175.1 gem-associated protein 7 [Ornithorhynchus anatinus]